MTGPRRPGPKPRPDPDPDEEDLADALASPWPAQPWGPSPRFLRFLDRVAGAAVRLQRVKEAAASPPSDARRAMGWVKRTVLK
jgi:hypothetical protein